MVFLIDELLIIISIFLIENFMVYHDMGQHHFYFAVQNKLVSPF